MDNPTSNPRNVLGAGDAWVSVGVAWWTDAVTLFAVGVCTAPRVQAGVDGFGRALATELGVAQFRGTARVTGTLQNEKILYRQRSE